MIEIVKSEFLLMLLGSITREQWESQTTAKIKQQPAVCETKDFQVMLAILSKHDSCHISFLDGVFKKNQLSGDHEEVVDDANDKEQ